MAQHGTQASQTHSTPKIVTFGDKSSRHTAKDNNRIAPCFRLVLFKPKTNHFVANGSRIDVPRGIPYGNPMSTIASLIGSLFDGLEDSVNSILESIGNRASAFDSSSSFPVAVTAALEQVLTIVS